MAVGFTPIQDDLYREIILDHYRSPRHKAPVDPADGSLEASNPLCGDELFLTWRCTGDQVDAIGFTGRGCSISEASASMMCEAITGLDRPAALELGERFRQMLMHDGSTDGLGDLEALHGVRAYPVRIKCALLAWTAMLHGLRAESPAEAQG